MDNALRDLLKLAEARTIKGHPDFYGAFDPERSKLLRDFYKLKLKIPVTEWPTAKIFNRDETVIARGYNRVVIGDYGAYIEIRPDQVIIENLRTKWGSLNPPRPVKYIWMVTQDSINTKVYWQRGTVKYADYKVGMYYVSPEDVIVEESLP